VLWESLYPSQELAPTSGAIPAVEKIAIIPSTANSSGRTTRSGYSTLRNIKAPMPAQVYHTRAISGIAGFNKSLDDVGSLPATAFLTSTDEEMITSEDPSEAAPGTECLMSLEQAAEQGYFPKDDAFSANIHAFKARSSPFPSTHAQAMRDPDAARWKKAEDKEHRRCNTFGCYVLVARPRGKNVVQLIWVYTIKRDGTFRARICAKGFQQVAGRDYGEVYSPVAKATSKSILVDLAVQPRIRGVFFSL
jgi:hypothetical protein